MQLWFHKDLHHEIPKGMKAQLLLSRWNVLTTRFFSSSGSRSRTFYSFRAQMTSAQKNMSRIRPVAKRSSIGFNLYGSLQCHWRRLSQQTSLAWYNRSSNSDLMDASPKCSSMRSCHGPRKFVPWLATKAAFLNGKSAINALYTVLIARVCTYIQVYNIYIYTVYYHDSNMTYTYIIVYIYIYILHIRKYGSFCCQVRLWMGWVSCEMLWRPFELQFKALPRQKKQIVVVSWCKKSFGMV